jgi:Arc/MetJ-type ribon-helix-helix transcriptional regulator
MDLPLSSQLDRLIQPWLASGAYGSQEEVLVAALRALDVHDQTLAAIAEGYADVEAGRYRSFDEADAEFRKRHNAPRET